MKAEILATLRTLLEAEAVTIGEVSSVADLARDVKAWSKRLTEEKRAIARGIEPIAAKLTDCAEITDLITEIILRYVHDAADGPVSLPSGVTYTQRAGYEITDPAAVPREYCAPAAGLISAALSDGAEIPGVRRTIVEVVSVRS